MTFLERAWYRRAGWLILLWPVSIIFRLLVFLRRRLLRPPAVTTAPRTVPVVVVGNLTLGGTGKTPLLMALAEHFSDAGYKPGIISRGYGGRGASYPMLVEADTAVALAGDEPVLMAANTGCPVVVDPDRSAALRHLLASEPEVNLVLSDDGLQHYRLHRDIEICVVDGQRQFGNGWCLPAGPLREPVSRLRQVDYVVVNGATGPVAHPYLQDAVAMTLEPRFLVNMVSGDRRPFAGAPFNIGNTVQAVTALGNPQRFLDSLDQLPYPLKHFGFPDHHQFSADDFDSSGVDDHQPVVMTEKDAVKCRHLARANFWCLSTEVELPQQFLDDISARLLALSGS